MDQYAKAVLAVILLSFIYLYPYRFEQDNSDQKSQIFDGYL